MKCSRSPIPRRSMLARHVLLLMGCFVLAAATALAGSRDGFFGSIRAVYDTFTLVLPVGAGGVGLVLLLCRSNTTRSYYPVGHLFLFAAILGGLRFYASSFEPHRLQVRHVEITSPRVTRPLRILHISDIQVFEFGPYEQRALELMAALKPDIILHTGDLTQPAELSQTHAIVADITVGLRAAAPPLGVYGVTGDTDWRLQHACVTPAELAPLQLLDNQTTNISVHGVELSILGLELSSSRSPVAAADLSAAWLATQPQGLRIMLGHSPDYVMGLADRDIDICLAGHTHGGQVRLPFIGPLLTMTSYIPREYALGHRMLGKTLLNVSAGIGSEHAGRVPPIRFLCPPDMTLITVTPATPASPLQ